MFKLNLHNQKIHQGYVSKLLTKLKLIWPNQEDRGVHVNVAGLALLKESKQPEVAVQFLEFFPDQFKVLEKSEAGRFYGRINRSNPDVCSF